MHHVVSAVLLSLSTLRLASLYSLFTRGVVTPYYWRQEKQNHSQTHLRCFITNPAKERISRYWVESWHFAQTPGEIKARGDICRSEHIPFPVSEEAYSALKNSLWCEGARTQGEIIPPVHVRQKMCVVMRERKWHTVGLGLLTGHGNLFTLQKRTSHFPGCAAVTDSKVARESSAEIFMMQGNVSWPFLDHTFREDQSYLCLNRNLFNLIYFS